MLLIRSKINITNLSFHRLLKPRALLLLAASSLLLGSFNAAHGTETGSNARSISNTTTTLPEQQATDIKNLPIVWVNVAMATLTQTIGRFLISVACCSGRVVVVFEIDRAFEPVSVPCAALKLPSSSELAASNSRALGFNKR